MKKINIGLIFIVLLSFGLSFYFYSQLPDRVASHWNAQGEVDGFMPKFWGLFLMPLLLLGLLAMFLVIPRIDPLRANIEKFRYYFDLFILFLLSFLLYLQILIVVWNLGFEFNMTYLLIPAFALLFYYIGILMEKAKRNWFIGVRTPWTLSSDRVWNKTHKLGSKLFKLAAIISVFGMLFEQYVIYFIIIPVITFSFYSMAYSYFEFKKENK